MNYNQQQNPLTFLFLHRCFGFLFEVEAYLLSSDLAEQIIASSDREQDALPSIPSPLAKELPCSYRGAELLRCLSSAYLVTHTHVKSMCHVRFPTDAMCGRPSLAIGIKWKFIKGRQSIPQKGTLQSLKFLTREHLLISR